jgi:hypothetical protein
MSMEAQRGDFGEWCITLFDVTARKRQDIQPDRLWRMCCRVVDRWRPDLERTRDVREVACRLMEELFQALRREERRAITA